jgi:hypothetical protein
MTLRAGRPHQNVSKGICVRDRFAMCVLYVITMSIPTSCNISYYPAQIPLEDKIRGLIDTADFRVRDIMFPCLDNVQYKMEGAESESEVFDLIILHTYHLSID